MTAAQRAALGIGDLEVPVPSHVCLFYSDEDELRMRLRFVSLALDTPGEVAVLFGPRTRLDEVLRYLREETGRDISADVAQGRIVLLEGASTGDATLARIGAALDLVVEQGATLIRFLGFIGWREPGWPSDADLVAFESNVNAAVLAYPAVVVCTYGLQRLDGNVLLWSGLGTHPFTVLGDVLCENDHYIPYDRFEAARTAGDREWLTSVRIRKLDRADAVEERS